MSTQNLWRGAAVLVVLASFVTPVAAQNEELEPNNSCASAQFFGDPPGWPFVITGELTPTGAEPPGDVDFFMLHATEGMRLRAGLRSDEASPFPLADPYLGLFDAECNLLAVNDDYQSLNSRLDFEVPVGSGGLFILAASGCCDFGFDGNHPQQGAYRLRVSIPPEPVASIAGRLVDAITNEPLAGGDPLYPMVELGRCVLDDCNYFTGNTIPDENGVFRFEADIYGAPLEPGQYVVRAYAGEYAATEIGPFAAVSGEAVDLGDIALQPPPYVFENVLPCADLPPRGGRCSYSVDVRNNTGAPVQGLGWSIVNTYGGTSPLGYSVFPADSTRHLQVAPLSSRKLRFAFNVPEDVAPGTSICADAWFADRDTAYFGTLRSQWLFCVSKQQDTLEIVDPKTAAGRLGIEALGGGLPGRRPIRH